MPDAVVVGAGPNGLVAANTLADAGWSVTVLEAAGEPGGAVRTGEITLPGYRHDLFSAFYPMAVASPAMRRLGLEDHGLRWRRGPLALAHPLPDGRCPSISNDLEATVESLEALHPGDGRAWAEMTRSWRRISEPFLAALLSPFPPLRPAAALFRRLGPHGAAALARHVMLPARRMGEELFPGEGAALLLGGNALHADVTPEAAGSGLFGWILSCLAQQYGYPVPEGGAGCLTAALVRRLEAGGGSVRCNARVTQILVEGGRAAAVVTEDGDRVAAGRAVLADVAAPALYQSLVGSGHLPPRYLADLQRFHWDMGTVKVDWALAEPVPWEAADARRAGTIHIADDFDNLTEFSGEIAMRRLPSRPFLLFGQQSVCDDTRSPPGTETAWAYTHVPRRITRDAAGVLGTAGGEKEWLDGFVERMEARVEELAPGFRALVRGRHVFSPADLEAADANLDLGAINGGTAQLHQQLIFRPVPGLARAETPIPGLFLASASAHPGGSVHGACGANAARAALGAMPRVRSVLLGRAPLERPRPGRS